MSAEREVRQIIGRVLVAVGQELLGEADTKTPLAPAAAKYLTLRAFARRAGFAESTVRSWVPVGLPTVPGGRGVRVNVDAADKWLANGGAKRAASRKKERRVDA